MSEIVKFTKLKTATSPTFWAKFAELKIDKFRLDEKAKIPLWGHFSLEPMDEGRTNSLILDCTSFNQDVETTSHNTEIACYGYMVNTNTYETFRQVDPQQFIDSMGKHVTDSIINGTALEEPWWLSMFLVLAYSDLKKYRFHYWAAHPTLFTLPEIYYADSPKFAASEFTANQIDKLSKGFLQLNARLKNFFVVITSGKDDVRIDNLSKGIEYAKLNITDRGDSEQADNEIYFAFYDPCVGTEPGWPLRNLLCLLFWHCSTFCFTQNIKVLSIRNDKMQTAIIFTLKSKQYIDLETAKKAIFEGHLVGWEPNINGKMGPNIADLSDAMNPIRLSDSAIGLNLKLMKWRLVPDLDLEKISRLRCLLLGAGTLGCAVARTILGWGISNMTLVDSSTVSHSNTVRQCLYTYEDAVQHRHKVDAAKDALLRIRPNMNIEGVILHIPMPGHVVGQSMMKTTEEASSKLQELIDSHDVVFLLLDSREARWLPTVICAAKNKIVINAALGFDSYTVQRHGTRNLPASSSPNLQSQNLPGYDLGCYFCNDITQPGNSQLDRTLDQQCTISRPGLSQIAGSLAVELLMAITQHPEGISARVFTDIDTNCQKDNELNGLLGGIPHTIRGSLWNHEMKLTVTHRFPLCTACSMPVIEEYRQRGFAFILDACNVPNYLEKLSGVRELILSSDVEELCYVMNSSSEEEQLEKELKAT